MTKHIYQGHFQDGTGRAVSSGNVTVYLAGTSTKASIYPARADESASSTLDSDSVISSASSGKFQFYVDDQIYTPQQKFDLSLSKTGFTSQTYPNVEVVPEKAYRYWIDPTATSQASTTKRGNRTVADHLATVGTSKHATFVYPHTGKNSYTGFNYAASLSLSAYPNIKHEYQQGAMASIDASMVLRNYSPANIIAGSTQQIFTGDGSVVFTASGGILYSGYFSDVQDMLDSISTNGQKFVVNPGTYTPSTVWTLPDISGGVLSGYGAVVNTSATSGYIISNNTVTATNKYGWDIKGFYLDGNANQAGGVYIQGWKQCIVEENYFYQSSYGVMFYEDSYYCELRNNKYRECTVGVQMDGSVVGPNESIIDGGSFELNTTGIYLNKVDSPKIINSAIEGSTTGLISGANGQKIKCAFTRFETNTNDVILNGSTAYSDFVFNTFIDGNSKVTDNGTQNNFWGNFYSNGFPFFTKAGQLRFYSQAYLSTTGIGLNYNQPVEWMTASGSGYGYKMQMDADQTSWILSSRYNSGSWVQIAKITSNNNNWRIGDNSNPDGSGGAKVAFASMGLDVLTAAPAAPRQGLICIADRATWDPLSIGAGGPYVVWYNGSAWAAIDSQ